MTIAVSSLAFCTRVSGRVKTRLKCVDRANVHDTFERLWKSSQQYKWIKFITIYAWLILEVLEVMIGSSMIPWISGLAPDSRAGGRAPAMESRLSTLATYGFNLWVRGSNLTGGHNLLSCPRSADTASELYLNLYLEYQGGGHWSKWGPLGKQQC